MKTIKHSDQLRDLLNRLRKGGMTIGFVPTMGCLHEGHLSLVRKAKKDNDIVVVSIFVNPLQFGPKEDFARYPRDFQRDARLLRREGVDFLFAPSPADLYSRNFQTRILVKHLSRPLCGATRPTHFAGVCTVVYKLLSAVGPCALVLGQKDYQQVRVLEQMIKDLDLPVKVSRAPIVRERDGLAMSSRNVFLSQAERQEAPLLYQALRLAARFVRSGRRDVGGIKKAVRGVLRKARHARLDYLEIVDAGTLQPVVKLAKGKQALVALAVFFNKARLIDNILIKG